MASFGGNCNRNPIKIPPFLIGIAFLYISNSTGAKFNANRSNGPGRDIPLFLRSYSRLNEINALITIITMPKNAFRWLSDGQTAKAAKSINMSILKISLFAYCTISMSFKKKKKEKINKPALRA